MAGCSTEMRMMIQIRSPMLTPVPPVCASTIRRVPSSSRSRPRSSGHDIQDQAPRASPSCAAITALHDLQDVPARLGQVRLAEIVAEPGQQHRLLKLLWPETRQALDFVPLTGRRAHLFLFHVQTLADLADGDQ